MVKTSKAEVLLFDSRSDQARILKEMLKDIGCRVSHVMLQYDCFAKLVNGRYDLMLFDHSIPGLHVADFVKELETIDRGMPVAMMVTLPSRHYEERYGCSGIDYLIFKPFGYDNLSLLVSEAFQYSRDLKKTFLNRWE